jgi:iron complex transport system permease protein
VVLVASVALGAGIALLQLSRGEPDLPLGAVVNAVLGGAAAGESTFLVRDLRLPRVLLGALAGAALGLAGTLLQGAFRNPIADPALLGISQAASLVVAVSVLIPGLIPDVALPLLCLLAGITTGAVLVLLARSVRDPVRLILLGVVLSLLYATCISVVLLLADNYMRLGQFLRFTTGSVSAAGWSQLGLVLPWLAVAIPAAVLCGRALNVLQLGDELASGLGMRVTRSRFALLLIALLLVAPVVAVVGPIGFVALLSPHVARFLLATGNAHQVLPAAAAVGALVVLAADAAGRLLLFPTEIPAGIWTVVVAGPAAIWLSRGLLRRRAET